MAEFENTKLMETENTEVNESYNEVNYSDEGNGGLLGVMIGVGVGLVAGGIAAFKNKDKIAGWVKQKQIAKCQKKAAKLGYTLSATVDEEFDEDDETAWEELEKEADETE